MNFSDIPTSSAIGRLLRAPLGLIPDSAVLPVLQGPLQGMRWIAGSSNHGCWLGSYEWEKQHLFAASVRPGDVVLDIGANVGFYTLLAAKQARSMGHVWAFEPLERNVTFLRKHLELNRAHNVEVVASAVGTRSGRARFHAVESHAMGALDRSGQLEVEVVSLDDLWQSGRIRAPDLIKADIEGGELAMLQGARQLFLGCRPRLFLATHGSQLHRECCALLREWGYLLHPIGRGDVETVDELLCLPQDPQAQ